MKAIFFACAMLAVVSQSVLLNDDDCVAFVEADSEKNCTSECKSYEKLSKAVDTSCLDETVKQVQEAAKRPLEHPLKAELCEENKCANKQLSKLVDTNKLGLAVAKAEIAAERPCDVSESDIAEEKKHNKMACKLGDLIDTTCLKEKVKCTKEAAKRPLEHPLKAELCKEDKCPNKCLSKLVDTNKLTEMVKAVKEVAGTV